MVFFFSSRRRHTRWTGDWSSDVCSSDLAAFRAPGEDLRSFLNHPVNEEAFLQALTDRRHGPCHQVGGYAAPVRSEERRVGKECRSRVTPYEYKRKRLAYPPSRAQVCTCM